MADEKRKGGGGRLTRSETVTVRLDPKVRYLAELAARKHRRTLSSFIEYAVEQSLEKVVLKEYGYFDNIAGQRVYDAVTVSQGAYDLWDVDESERFMRLAIHFPDLMSHNEQITWKVLKDSGFLEPALARGKNEMHQEVNGLIVNKIVEEHIFPALRREWEGLNRAIKDGKKQEWVATTRKALKDGTLFPDLPFEQWAVNTFPILTIEE